MSEPIKVGDLVMVVRGHECVVKAIGGMPFTVEYIGALQDLPWRCSRCGAKNVYPPTHYAMHPSGTRTPLPWLKRIPPLGELEGEKQKEDLREPA